jgi:MFS family permease
MRLSSSAAFYLQASIILFFLAGSSAPTPLYAVYQAAWGFSPITITVIFGVYALAVLTALLVAGSLSDHVGRRPVLIVAALAQAVAMILFATAHGVGALMLARVVQGLSTGAAAGAVGAGLLDLDRTRGTLANSVAPMLGTASGGLLSGLLVEFLPAPRLLVYLVLGVIFIAQAIGVALMPETVTRRPGALASLRPHFRLPAVARAPMLLAVPALIATWALVGFYCVLAPAMVRKLADTQSLALSGVVLFVLGGSGVAAVLAARAWSARHLLLAGTAGLIAGAALTLAATYTGSLVVFFAGLILAGLGVGGGFQGAIRSVVPLVAPSERAGVLSIVYVVAYLSMGLPAVLGGVRVVHGGGVITTAREYGVAVIALAAFALIGTLVRRPARAAVPAVRAATPSSVSRAA